ncbi:putative membrane protein YeiB [Georgenia muralis]|uniref:Putative membrane protein YeiB n=2 Tax=Georgenia muralis TaxID=154117 RepID=A0A3N4Z8F5_9MICO|nr:putative membrane protein YeiB [Georgenia muralis]
MGDPAGTEPPAAHRIGVMVTAVRPAPVAPISSPPSPGRGRVAAIDAARALAVMGMIVVNVGPRSGDSISDVLYRLPLGRASLLFVLLAGVGISLLTRRARLPGGRLPWATLLWRAGLLMTGGLALQLLDHGVSVILPTYALLFVIAIPLVRAGSRVVGLLAVALTVLGPVAWIGLQRIQGVTWDVRSATAADSPSEVLHSVLLSSPYPVITWAGPFLLGMWLGRLDLADRALQHRMILFGAFATVIGRAVSLVLVAWRGDPAETIGFDRLVTSVAHSQMPLWLISGTGSGVLVLGLLLRTGTVVERRLRPLVAMGQLALTIYVAHLLVLDLLVRPEPHVLAEGIGISLALSASALIFATWWRRNFDRGPLERLLRPPWREANAPDGLGEIRTQRSAAPGRLSASR